MDANRITFNVALLAEDMALRGWAQVDLLAQINRAKPPVTQGALSKFLCGKSQSARLAFRCAKALGQKDSRRYLISRRRAA